MPDGPWASRLVSGSATGAAARRTPRPTPGQAPRRARRPRPPGTCPRSPAHPGSPRPASPATAISPSCMSSRYSGRSDPERLDLQRRRAVAPRTAGGGAARVAPEQRPGGCATSRRRLSARCVLVCGHAATMRHVPARPVLSGRESGRIVSPAAPTTTPRAERRDPGRAAGAGAAGFLRLSPARTDMPGPMLDSAAPEPARRSIERERRDSCPTRLEIRHI